MAAEKKIIEEPEKEKKFLIKLPLSRDKQDDVFVGINGMTYKIKRGEEVEVSEAVYEVLKHSEKMDLLALKRQKSLSGE